MIQNNTSNNASPQLTIIKNIVDVNTKSKEFVNKSDISGFINNTNLDEKIKNLAEVSRIKSGAGENKKIRNL